MIRIIIYLLAIIVMPINLFAQQMPDGGGEYIFETYDKCLSNDERSSIKKQLADNVAQLKAEGKLPTEPQRMIISLDWPLRQTAGLNYFNYYGIGNFVDQNSSTGLLDYNCDARTYEGHQGTDIFTWPFTWYLYENNFVEVIAAEAGTIIGKDDGYADDHCSCYGNWNAVYVQHADGSVIWYGHLKKNLLTSKGVGQAVAKGEYIGVVASSGCSFGPHLHMEIYDSGNNLIDPYQGTCNGLNTSSWWASQAANRTPRVNALMTHDAEPLLGCPAVNEVPNMADKFSSGEIIYLAVYFQDQLFGDLSTFRIRRPDNTVWNTWTHTSPDTYDASYWFWTRFLPVAGPFGTWTFEAVYNGQTYIHEFEYTNSPLPVDLLSFKGKALDEAAVLLDWSTAAEHNNQGFEIGHSTDGLAWRTLDFVKGQENSLAVNDYNFLHSQPVKGQNYYRLKQVDFDGNVEYSPIINIPVSKGQDFEIYPNPANESLTINGLESGIAELKIMDRYGRTVLEKFIGDGEIDISYLSAGIYFVSINLGVQMVAIRLVKL